MIDEALLRPGRLELHVEIGLPDEYGRHSILNIHTKKFRAPKKRLGDVSVTCYHHILCRPPPPSLLRHISTRPVAFFSWSLCCFKLLWQNAVFRRALFAGC